MKQIEYLNEQIFLKSPHVSQLESFANYSIV